MIDGYLSAILNWNVRDCLVCDWRDDNSYGIKRTRRFSSNLVAIALAAIETIES